MNSDLDDDFGSASADEFGHAANYLQHLVNELDQSTLLVFYGLYKQATVGRCNTTKPGIFSVQARAKWNAWNDLKDMTSESAMTAYVGKLTAIKPEWNEEVKADGERSKKAAWVAVSTPVAHDDGPRIDEADKTLIDHVKEESVDVVRRLLLSTTIDVNARDVDGLCAIHWAADRGNAVILHLLLQHGANVDEQEAEGGQTALHYAAGCGHMECVEILLQFNADRSIVDHDSATCLDLAIESDETEIIALLEC